MATLSLRRLVMRFGATTVLHGIDLDIADGEFVVLVGPSGCGKSTLLRLIAGLEEASGGAIEIGGHDVGRVPPQRRDVAMVFQSYALFPHMSVRENIAYGPKVRGEAVGARVEEAAAMLNLTPHLDRHPRELSGGQRQRVAMGRALMREPKLFLFDEPLSNLDAQLRVAMRAEIKALHERLGNTVIYVTHDQVEAMTMADRIVVMEGGRIAQEGAPLDLYDRPASLFVAGFIGSPAMSFLHGRLDGGRLRLAGLDLPAAHGGTRAVVVGVRPEALRLDGGGDGDGIPAFVRVIEPMGPETHVLADLADKGAAARGPVETATDLRMVMRDRLRLRPGEPVRLGVNPAALHLFDPETGLRLEASP